MNLRLLVVIIVVLLGLSILEWRPWHQTTLPQTTETNRTDSPNLSPVKITSSDTIPTSTFEVGIRAQLTAANYTTIASEISAKVESVRFKEGESFKRGDTLISLECSIQAAQLQRAQATFNIAERNYLANRKLLSHGAVSRIEVENAASELQKSQAELAELKAIYGKCLITAPFDGKIVEQRIRQDQFVQVGQVLLEILDQSSLEVEFIAPSSWYARVKKDNVLEITIDETKKTYPIRIERIGAKIDAVSQTMKIVAVIDGLFTELSPGMSGSIKNPIPPPR